MTCFELSFKAMFLDQQQQHQEQQQNYNNDNNNNNILLIIDQFSPNIKVRFLRPTIITTTKNNKNNNNNKKTDKLGLSWAKLSSSWD